MKTYFICNKDSFGQRTGTYEKIMLPDSKIILDQYNNKTYKGQFLYESEEQVILSCKN